MFLSGALLHLAFIISKLQTLVSFCSSRDSSEKVLLYILWRTFDLCSIPTAPLWSLLVYYVRFHSGSHSAAMTQCTVAGNSISVSANQHLTVCPARQKSVAGCKGWPGFFLIYKKNVPDCVNSEVFVGGFGLGTRDWLHNLFLTLKNESEGFRKHPPCERPFIF